MIDEALVREFPNMAGCEVELEGWGKRYAYGMLPSGEFCIVDMISGRVTKMSVAGRKEFYAAMFGIQEQEQCTLEGGIDQAAQIYITAREPWATYDIYGRVIRWTTTRVKRWGSDQYGRSVYYDYTDE